MKAEEKKEKPMQGDVQKRIPRLYFCHVLKNDKLLDDRADGSKKKVRVTSNKKFKIHFGFSGQQRR